MDDFGDDLFDEFEKPSASSFTVVQKSDDDLQKSEEKYDRMNMVQKPNYFYLIYKTISSLNSIMLQSIECLNRYLQI